MPKSKLDGISKKLIEMLQTLGKYESAKKKLMTAIRKVESGYQRGQFNYFQYQKLISDLLKGKNRTEWLVFYDRILIKILKEYNYWISQFYLEVKKDTSAKELKLEMKNLLKEKTGPFWKKYQKPKPAVENKTNGFRLEKFPTNKELATKQTQTKKKTPRFGLTDEEKVVAEQMIDKPQEAEVSINKEESEKSVRTTEKSMLNKIIDDSGDVTMLKDDVELKNPFSFAYIRHVIKKLTEKETFDQETTEVPKELIDLNKIKSVVSEVDQNHVAISSLSTEARKFKKIISRKEKDVTQSMTSFGAIANLLLKKWSLRLIEIFPDFFKKFYSSLRVGNVRVLSSTYTNVMILSILIVMFFTFFGVGFILLFLGENLVSLITRTLFMTLLFSVTTFFVYYAYPYMRINQRRKNIKTNLPFAVNHMSAVASSGVAPDTMFRLLSKSEEYGSICGELMKVVDYIDVFGYDLLNAIRSVAKITPAPELKEFFEGFISTIETGGDLKDFLRQKAEEYMLTYKLERQKYTESISLYSDIYTGVLIAAPLFFVVALSLVNILGGKVGTLDVELLISLGTYVAIPFLNIAFIVFLEMSQPES